MPNTNTIQVGILGLRRMGASLGLALKRYTKINPRQGFTITGFDTNPTIADGAKTRGVVDSISRNPAEAAAGKDVVILSLPLGELEQAFRLINGQVREGAVVLETSPLKGVAMRWGEALLTSGAHLVGVTPVLNPAYLFDGADDLEHAQADLFDNGLLLLAPSASASSAAVELAADLAQVIGASARFVDPAEHDVWQAAMEGLPALLGYATFHMLRTSKTWDDAQRVGNPAFGRLTHHLYDTHPADVRALILHNRDAMLRPLDTLIETLTAFRAAIAENDHNALDAAFEGDAEAHERWWAKRQRGQWDDENNTSESSTSDQLVRGMLGGYLSDRLKGRKGNGT